MGSLKKKERQKIDKQKIRKYLFEELNPTLNPEDDELLFYFGGHGKTFKDPIGEEAGYLLLSNYDESKIESTALSMFVDIQTRFVRQIKAKHILFVIDACVADVGLTRGYVLPSKEELRNFKKLNFLRNMMEAPGRTILTAGTDGQDAIDKNGGIFTKAFMDALKGKADRDGNGVIDLDEMYAHIAEEVNFNAKLIGGEQSPGRWNIPSSGFGQLLHVYRGSPFRALD